jgi:hypothetical protein
MGRTCASCGQAGHNRRTCILHRDSNDDYATSKVEHRICSLCGEHGHNVLTCQQTNPKKAAIRILKISAKGSRV